MTTDYKSYFKDVGDRLETAWRAHQYDDLAFPELAMKTAEHIEIEDSVELASQLYGTFNTSHRFSELDLMVYEREHFRIEALHWLSNPTSIHQHGFCGAFKLMSGRSLHITYDFKARKRLAHDLMIGDLKVADSEIMKTGDVRPIAAGERFVHANYHLGRPTMTLVVRTMLPGLTGAQLSYMPPHFAFDGLKSYERRDRMIEFMAQVGQQSGRFETVICHHLQEATLEESLQTLLSFRILEGDAGRLARFLEIACNRHPDAAFELEATIMEARRSKLGQKIRRHLQDRLERLLMALLVNFSDARFIRLHIAQEFPQENSNKAIARLLHSIAAKGLLPAFPAADLALLEALLDDTTSTVPESLATLYAHPLLAPLFAATSVAAVRANVAAAVEQESMLVGA